jgi:RHS repeat-associated protein
MDGQQRIALVETKTISNPDDESPNQLIRYQFGNHLGSASLELDDKAYIISYEEYSPYGSSTYQAVRSQTESPKRYRYTGKERDEENGLYYHGARYYIAWLARWSSPDPMGMIDSSNLYSYVNNNPVAYADPTGMVCDPKTQSCPDATEPTPREEQEQRSIPEEHLPPETPEPDTTVPQPYVKSPLEEYYNDPAYHDIAGPPPPPAATPPPSAELSGSDIPKLTQNEADTLNVPYLATQGFRNPYAQVLAAQGKTHLAVIWEGGFICSGCHLTHFSDGTNDKIDLSVFAYQVQVAAYTHLAANLLGAAGAIAEMGTGPGSRQIAANASSSTEAGQPPAASRGVFNARNVSQGGNLNCSECVVNFEASAQAGRRVRVQIPGGNAPTQLTDHMNRLTSVGANPRLLPVTYSNQFGVTSAVSRLPPGTRFSIWADRGPGQVGHVFGGYIDGSGVVRFLEPQVQSAASWSGYSSFRVIVH